MNNKTKATKVIEAFEYGQSLKDCLIYFDISVYHFGKTLHTFEALSFRYENAKKALCDLLCSEMIGIADNQDSDPNRSKVMIDARKWLASKWLPKVYGDRLDLNINEVIDIRSALDKAKGRVIDSKAKVIAQHDVVSADNHSLVIEQPQDVVLNKV